MSTFATCNGVALSVYRDGDVIVVASAGGGESAWRSGVRIPTNEARAFADAIVVAARVDPADAHEPLVAGRAAGPVWCVRWYAAVGIHDSHRPTASGGWTLQPDTAEALAQGIVAAAAAGAEGT